MPDLTDLTQRYGAPNPTARKVGVAAVVVVVALGLSWLAWVILVHTRPLAQSELVSYDVTGAHAADARFTVARRDADVEASCLLRATAADHAIVGELDVAVGPGTPTTATLARTIRTERRATSVEMVGCTTPEQAHRR